MRKIFVDTSAYFSLANDKDINHENATRIMYNLGQERADLITTNYVIAETHGLILKRIGYTTALQVIEEIYKSRTRIYRVREVEERKALEIVRKYTDKEFSLIDTISFATMESLHLRQVFT